MEENARIISVTPRNSPLVGLDRVVDVIGTEDFSGRLAGLLREACGAAYYSAFYISGDQATVMASSGFETPQIATEHAHRYVDGFHWKHDPALTPIKSNSEWKAAVLVEVDTTRLDDIVLRRDFYNPAGIGAKLAINMKRDEGLFVLNLLRKEESGQYSDIALERVAAMSDVLISLLARHAKLIGCLVPENTLSSADLIENRLLSAEAVDSLWRLTKRERQVCARILYGMTALGISLDLGIKECSVDTYRKRAYHRLGIATRHELLRMYLALDPRSTQSIH